MTVGLTKDFHEAQVRKISIQRGGWTFAGLLKRMDRKLERNAARITNARLHPFGKLNVVAVTGHEIVARLRNPDDGFA